MRELSARTLIAVVPALFADVLCRALRHEGLEVVMYRSGDVQLPASSQEFALALVSDEVPADVSASAVLRLPDLGEPDLARFVGIVRSSLGTQDLGAGSSST